MPKTKRIYVEEKDIRIQCYQGQDYISLSDMVKHDNGEALITKWASEKSTIEFLGIWEQLYNPDFDHDAYRKLMLSAGSHRFTLKLKQWVNLTKAQGIISKTGRYGGLYAHRDIAFELGSWVSPSFKLMLIRAFQQLKEKEDGYENLDWNVRRTLSKVNYTLHTGAIKENLIPAAIGATATSEIYASEADVLNMALFGVTAAQWRDENEGLKGNIRDYANLEQLVVLSNIESINAVLIRQGMSQHDRIIQLNQIAIEQMASLVGNKTQLKKKPWQADKTHHTSEALHMQQLVTA